MDSRHGGTPAMLMLQAAGIDFTVHEFAHHPGEGNYGTVAAAALGLDPDQVFKTLLAKVEGLPTPGIAVGIVPVSGQLSLKELATAVGGKRAEMCDPAVAQRVTGYVVGGISPFGQKKLLSTAIDETCELYDTIFVSGGKRGLDIEIAPEDLIQVLGAVVAPIGVAR
ncbi:MAG: Cys-tRNA(Pro) deacylase [Ilumatobacteraceae bacterium]